MIRPNQNRVRVSLLFLGIAASAPAAQYPILNAPAPIQRAPSTSSPATKDSPALKREVAPDFLAGSRSAQRIRAKGLDPKDPTLVQKLAVLASQYSRNFGTKSPSVRFDKPMMNRTSVASLVRRETNVLKNLVGDTTPPKISCIVGLVSPGVLKTDVVQENGLVIVYGRFPSRFSAALQLDYYQFPCGRKLPLSLTRRAPSSGSQECGSLPDRSEVLTYEIPTFPPFVNVTPGIQSADLLVESEYGYSAQIVDRIRGFPGKTVITLPISLSPPYQSGDAGVGLQASNNFFTGTN